MLYTVLWTYLTSVKTAIGLTPLQLVYGVEVLPIECKNVAELLPNTTLLEERLIHLEQLDEFRIDVATTKEAHKER